MSNYRFFCLLVLATMLLPQQVSARKILLTGVRDEIGSGMPPQLDTPEGFENVREPMKGVPGEMSIKESSAIKAFTTATNEDKQQWDTIAKKLNVIAEQSAKQHAKTKHKVKPFKEQAERLRQEMRGNRTIIQQELKRHIANNPEAQKLKQEQEMLRKRLKARDDEINKMYEKSQGLRESMWSITKKIRVIKQKITRSEEFSKQAKKAMESNTQLRAELRTFGKKISKIYRAEETNSRYQEKFELNEKLRELYRKMSTTPPKQDSHKKMNRRRYRR